MSSKKWKTSYDSNKNTTATRRKRWCGLRKLVMVQNWHTANYATVTFLREVIISKP